MLTYESESGIGHECNIKHKDDTVNYEVDVIYEALPTHTANRTLCNHRTK